MVSVTTTQKVTMMRRDSVGWGGSVEPNNGGQKAASNNIITKVAPVTVVAKAVQTAVAQVAATGGISTAHCLTLGCRGQDLRAGSGSHSQSGIGGGSGNGTAALKAEAAAD